MTATVHPNDTACPEWCAGDHWPFPHRARFGSVTLTDEEFTCNGGTTTVVSLTTDLDGETAVEFGDGGHLVDFRFSLAEAEQIAEFLSQAIAAGRAAQRPTDGPESHAREINTWGRGVPMVECRDCPTAFHPDSSPHPDRCWICAEKVDGGVTV